MVTGFLHSWQPRAAGVWGVFSVTSAPLENFTTRKVTWNSSFLADWFASEIDRMLWGWHYFIGSSQLSYKASFPHILLGKLKELLGSHPRTFQLVIGRTRFWTGGICLWRQCSEHCATVCISGKKGSSLKLGLGEEKGDSKEWCWYWKNLRIHPQRRRQEARSWMVWSAKSRSFNYIIFVGCSDRKMALKEVH